MNFYQFTELLIVDNHIMNPNVTDERVQQAREDIAKIIREELANIIVSAKIKVVAFFVMNIRVLLGKTWLKLKFKIYIKNRYSTYEFITIYSKFFVSDCYN